MLKNYLQSIGTRRFCIMLLGNVCLGMGISIFKLSGLGNDPFSGMVMALAELAGTSYAGLLLLVNLAIFIMQFFCGRELIGAGTLVNACLLGYIVTFFNGLWINTFGAPQLLWQRVVIVCVGVIITSLGVSLYQTPDVGIAPYDSISLIMVKRRPKIPYFWHRISNDGLTAVICYLAGGVVGLGTLLAAFGLGPFIHFFNIHVSQKLLKGAKQGGHKTEN